MEAKMEGSRNGAQTECEMDGEVRPKAGDGTGLCSERGLVERVTAECGEQGGEG